MDYTKILPTKFNECYSNVVTCFHKWKKIFYNFIVDHDVPAYISHLKSLLQEYSYNNHNDILNIFSKYKAIIVNKIQIQNIYKIEDKNNPKYNDIYKLLGEAHVIMNDINILTQDNKICSVMHSIYICVLYLKKILGNYIKSYNNTKQCYLNKTSWYLGYYFNGVFDSNFGYIKRSKLFERFENEELDMMSNEIKRYNVIIQKNREIIDEIDIKLNDLHKIIKANQNDKLVFEINGDCKEIVIENINGIDYDIITNAINKKIKQTFNNIHMKIVKLRKEKKDYGYEICCSQSFKLLPSSTLLSILGFDQIVHVARKIFENEYMLESKNNCDPNVIKENYIKKDINLILNSLDVITNNFEIIYNKN